MVISGQIEDSLMQAALAVMQGMQASANAVDAQRMVDWLEYWRGRALRAEANLAQARRALAQREHEFLELEAMLEDA